MTVRHGSRSSTDFKAFLSLSVRDEEEERFLKNESDLSIRRRKSINKVTVGAGEGPRGVRISDENLDPFERRTRDSDGMLEPAESNRAENNGCG